MRITFALIIVAVILLVTSLGSSTSRADDNSVSANDSCGTVAGVEVFPDGTLGDFAVCKTPSPSDHQSNCGEVTGISFERDLPGLENFEEAVGIEVCEPQKVVAQGIGAASGFTYNGVEVDPSTIPVTAGSSAVDTDLDNCSDVDEVAIGLDPNNGLDWLDHKRDGVLDAKDAQAVAFRVFMDVSDEYYKPYYDRSSVDGQTGPPDGNITINDLQQVFNQFGLTCSPVVWPQTEQSVCNKLAVEAASEGVDEFVCSQEANTAGFVVDDVDKIKRVAEVRIHDDFVHTETITGEFNQLSGSPPPEANTAGGPVTLEHPLLCETNVCRGTLVRDSGVTFLGRFCATFLITMRYSVYAPWAGIFDVAAPIVTGSTRTPCSEEHLSWGQIDSSPYWAENWLRWTVEGGIPSPWGQVGLRSWTEEPHYWFDGLFQYDEW